MGRHKKDKKNRRKTGKNTNGNNNNGDNKHGDNKDSLEMTATAEGQTMAQVLSTFSKLEQSRFEAFRKASFPRDAISKYVAHCLINEQHRSLSNGFTTDTDTYTDY